MNILDKAQLSLMNAELAFMRMSPLKRRLLMIAGVVAATQLACVLPALFSSVAHPTAAAPLLIDPTHVAHIDPTAVSDHITLGQPICNITDFGHLGANAQGVNFPAAIPEGQHMALNCGGVEHPTILTYNSSVFPNDTTFVMGPDAGDNVNRMAQIGDTIRQVPADPRLSHCTIDAFAAPVGNGGPAYTTNIDLSAGDHVVAPITTVGNSSSILATDRFTSPPGFDIHPEYLAGAGGDPYTKGNFAWAVFKWVADAAKNVTLGFQGIVRPGQDCPIYIDQP